jgi:hypothetical protein
VKPRDYQKEDGGRATKQVKVRVWLDDLPKVEATRALGYSLAEILLAGCEALQNKKAPDREGRGQSER